MTDQIRTLTVVFEPCEEGGFHVFVPEISGLMSQGDSLPEALGNLADAWHELIEANLENTHD
jgi:predicted RNase H-like HicB family nuclease